MSVNAITPDYAERVEIRDRQENFHGNQVVYVHWEKHLSFCAALAFPLPPAMPFAALIDNILKPFYGAHPDAGRIDWAKVEWDIDGQRVAPAMDKSLAENGVAHKSLIRFWTPGLDGWHGTAN
ncbi:MAG TPA: phenol hydroxylase subunit P4 [Dongiaceae bacterium]|nr:phenol hydroxylase subunit P4 [Dongiaceae bacterium]